MRERVIEKTAGMLREMPRRVDQLLGKLHYAIKPRVIGIEPDAARFLLLHARLRPAPEHAGESADGVVRQSEHLADLADSAASAIADDGSGHAGMMAAVSVVDVLNHLLAAIVFEVDVDVRRFLALLGDETLEQKVDFGGIHLGNTEAVADHGIRRRATALAQDAFGARVFNNRVDGEKVFCVAKLAGDVQFAVERITYLIGDSVRITPFRSFLSQILQCLMRIAVAFTILIWIFCFLSVR